jgi:hypothetical protein
MKLSAPLQQTGGYARVPVIRARVFIIALRVIHAFRSAIGAYVCVCVCVCVCVRVRVRVNVCDIHMDCAVRVCLRAHFC